MGAEVVEGERKCVQRAGVAGSLGQVDDQLRARLVIPEVHGDVARQPAPPDVVAAEGLITKRGKRSREHRRGCGVAVCEPHRKPVQEQVDGACGLRRCGCAAAWAASARPPRCRSGRRERLPTRPLVGSPGPARGRVVEALGGAEQQRRRVTASLPSTTGQPSENAECRLRAHTHRTQQQASAVGQNDVDQWINRPESDGVLSDRGPRLIRAKRAAAEPV